MPYVSLNQISWDPALVEYKGRDTEGYVRTVVGAAARCTDCQLPLTSRDRISLIVDVQQESDSPLAYKHYDAYVCHASCQGPELTVRTVPGLEPDEGINSYGARITLGMQGPFGTQLLPAFVFGHTQSVTLREPGGERTSVGMAFLLEAGFQLQMDADLGRIHGTYPSIPTTSSMKIARGRDLVFTVNGVEVYSLALDPKDPGDMEWVAKARELGAVMGLVGENLGFTGPDSSPDFDLDTAARLGTLAAGSIPFI